MTYDMRPSDHAFEAFLAGCGDRFEGVEKLMLRYFKTHPGQQMFRAVEAAIQAYEREKK